jgi:myo-inositol-1(or 4)-monophosphatase
MISLQVNSNHPLFNSLSIAYKTACIAGAYILKGWNTDFKVEYKGTVDLVSEIDLGAQILILDELNHHFPHDTYCAEESDDFSLDLLNQDRVWVIDPLDGTTNFSHGFPHFCVSIALVSHGIPQVGVIHDPIRNWTWYALKGQGAWRDQQPLHVAPPRPLHQALLATGFPYDRHTSHHDNLAQTSFFLKRIQGLRRAGAAALDLAYVATGWLDGYWEYKLKPWDCAAGGLLVQEAGGIISDTDGDSFWLQKGSLVCASHLDLYKEIKQGLEETYPTKEFKK